MNTRYVRALAVLAAAAFLLSGCDTIGGWFSGSGKKSNLKGERISVMTLDEALQVDTALKDVPVVLPPPYRNVSWPEPGGYASNAMYHLEAPGPLQVIWEQDAGKGSDSDSRITAPPIVADGRVFVLDSAAHVFAFNARTGAPLWGKALAPKGGEATFLNIATFGLLGKDQSTDPSKGFGGGVAYDNGRLFVTTGFGQVEALEAATGKDLWKVDFNIPILNAPTANGGRVFVSTEDNHLYALAQDTGRQLWDNQGISVSAGIMSSTSAAVAGEYVIAPYSSGEVFALRTQGGRTLWNDTLTRTGTITALSELDDIAARPVLDRDLVIAISHSGVMAAIKLATGDRVWSRDIGGTQTPWVAGDFLYVVTSDSDLLCLTRKDGKVKWAHQLQRFRNEEDQEDPIFWAGPVLVSDKLILVSSHGTAVSISPYTGALNGRIEIPGGVFIAPVVADGRIYIYTNHGSLVALQ